MAHYIMHSSKKIPSKIKASCNWALIFHSGSGTFQHNGVLQYFCSDSGPLWTQPINRKPCSVNVNKSNFYMKLFFIIPCYIKICILCMYFKTEFNIKCIIISLQPINVPTAGARAFLMDYTQGERAITHHVVQCRLEGANDCKCSRDQRLNVPSVAQRSSI
jgi:hypothetical protein